MLLIGKSDTKGESACQGIGATVGIARIFRIEATVVGDGNQVLCRCIEIDVERSAVVEAGLEVIEQLLLPDGIEPLASELKRLADQRQLLFHYL